jgi:hypothetical protein
MPCPKCGSSNYGHPARLMSETGEKMHRGHMSKELGAAANHPIGALIALGIGAAVWVAEKVRERTWECGNCQHRWHEWN